MMTSFLPIPGLKKGVENTNCNVFVWNRVRIWRNGRHTPHHEFLGIDTPPPPTHPNPWGGKLSPPSLNEADGIFKWSGRK